jgi:hypothetical protein
MYHKSLCDEARGFHKTSYESYVVGTYPIICAFQSFHQKHQAWPLRDSLNMEASVVLMQYTNILLGEWS